ncbi:MAG: glycosyltransferase family 9 protein [Fluviibacter sp.]
MNQAPQKILVIRRDNIGDLVCTTPLFSALRVRYPKAQIAALVNTYNAEVLRGNPDLDLVFVYKKLKHVSGSVSRIKAICERISLMMKLRRWNPDVTVLAKAGYDKHGLNFAHQIGARQIVGFLPENSTAGMKLPDIALSTPECTSVHEVEAVHQLLKSLDVHVMPGPLKVYPNAEVAAKLKEKTPVASPCIALHISAREVERRWGLQNFIVLTQNILEMRPKSQLLLFWAPGKAGDPHHPGDDEAAAELLKVVASDRLIPVATQNLTELIGALSVCDLFIGTDGGALHLAAGLNKPCVALFENLPSKLNHWYPWQVPNRVVHGGGPEVASIRVEQVMSALDALEADLKRSS